MVRTIGIVSLSSGTIGEGFVSHEIEIGLKRLENYGIKVKFMPNALKGIEFVKNHPECRASDMIKAFEDDETDMILCAVGGDDTYRLLPYLFEHDELKNAVKDKIFLGFSDTTVNHFMLHKLGINTFYGQAFLPDVCELDSEMLTYSKEYFEMLITTGAIDEIVPSDIWYESRTDFGKDQIGESTPSHDDTGFELLQGSPVFEGEIFGGCIDTIYDMFFGDRYEDMPELCRRYGLFPQIEDWKGKILLLESSEELMSGAKYAKTLNALKEYGLFDVISGILIGKPVDRICEEDYKRNLVRIIDNKDLPIVTNINVGHALPRCIIPFGVKATVDTEKQIISFRRRYK